MFIATYEGLRSTGHYYLKSTAPRTPKSPEVSKEVQDVSPHFVTILSQAAAAESFGLDQVAGVGYRKALEFIIKDFCIAEHEHESDAIKGMFLGQVIDKYVDSGNIKSCAKLASWLGNDETHYVRRWEDKDISDLKTLLKLTEGWIRDHLLTRKYLGEMQ